LFAVIRNAYSNRVYVDKELTEKTKRLLREHTHSGALESPQVIYELSARELQKLKDSASDDTLKILNLRKLIAAKVADEGASQLYLRSIGERAEALAQALEERQLETQHALKQYEQLVEEVVQATDEQQALQLDANTYALYVALKTFATEQTPAQARDLNAQFARFPDYTWNEQQRSQLRAELYKTLRPIVGPARMIETANALLKLQRV
jgi:type I restriction enzyme R subunit